MYITDRHTCFAASSGSVSFSLPHKAKQTVKKLLQGVGSGEHLLKPVIMQNTQTSPKMQAEAAALIDSADCSRLCSGYYMDAGTVQGQ